MLSSANESLFRTSSKIDSQVKVILELNYNSLVESTKYGCYLSTPYNTSYQANNSSGFYDDGNAYQYFDNGGVDTTTTATASTNSLTVASATGISIGMRVSGFGIPADTYVTNVVSTNVTISKNVGTTIASGTPISFFTYSSSLYKKRNEYSPLSSIFQPHRPDPGIVNLFAYRGADTVTAGSLKAGNFGNATGGTRLPRVYPIYKDSRFRYWSSVRKIATNNILSTVGVSNSDGTITHAAPFVIYSDSFYTNKITVKTQKHQGTPVDFKIEYLPHGETTWTSALNVTGSTEFSDGIINIYYSGGSWSTTEASATQLTSPTDSLRIYGVRFSVTKMSAGRKTLDVIEISPRLQLDISEHVLSFDKSSTVEGSLQGAPSTGIISGGGSLSIFNTEKLFSLGTSNSIISNFLYSGVEVRAFQIVNSENIKLGTYYVESWSDSGTSTITANLEDYFYILKRTKAPNINIANISGIETSVATLILLDNSGITNYDYVKAYTDSRDDYVMDFFFCSDDQTVADVLGDIANSSQCSIFIDANNTIKVVTKEAFNANRAAGNTDFWLVGTEDWAVSDPEYTYLNGNYVANMMSISEQKIPPVTEMTVSYAGNGITRQPKAILKTPELFNDTNNAFYNASIISRELSYVNSELWTIDSEEGSDKVLLSMPYLSNISTSRPSAVSNGGSATGVNELIRSIYSSANASDKEYFEIVLDQERGIEFLQANKFSGHIMIDAELIKYNGIVVDVFDPSNSSNSGRKIVFSKEEAQYLRNSASSGVSILVYSILVELVYKPTAPVGAMTSDNITYTFVSDGRAQENTTIAQHTKTSESAMTSNKFSTRLFAGSITSAVKASTSMKSESVNLKDPRNPSAGKTYSYPGYMKISGPKGIKGAIGKPGISSALQGRSYIPIDNYGERFITGIYRDLGFSPNVIATRMRLVEKPKKRQGTEPSNAVSPENRGIAGIGFRLKDHYSGSTYIGTSGYFVEIEDAANITATQLERQAYTNLRLYKVSLTGGVFVPEVLKSAWVNVTATAGESLDLSNAVQNEGKSYSSTSDLLVTISEDKQSYIYKVYWETNLVISYKESKTATRKPVNPNSKRAGLMVRFDSVALFDYFLAVSASKNGEVSVPQIFSDGSKYIKAVDAAERGILPSVVTDASVSNGNLKYEFEDFGNQIREAKKYEVKFSNPAVSANLITLGEVNKQYKISDFSASSYTASFWAFNTSRGSISLSLDSSTPIIISGVAIEELNQGELTLSKFLSNKSNGASEKLLFNRNKYGENSISYSAKYINSLAQAESILDWVWEKRSYEKRSFNISMFPNPLLEIGDKVRIFDSNIDHKVLKTGDKSYYITSISYSISQTGPTMSITVEEA
jgi:hypothetical protein